MTSTTTPQELASEALRHFTTARRQDESEYVKLTDTAPQWLHDLVRAAHGTDPDGSPAMLPDDFRYRAIRSALDCISEADEPEDASREWADSECDVYTGELLAWLGSHATRLGYCDEAQTSGLVADDTSMSGRITAGQYVELCEVFDLVLQGLHARSEA